MKTFCSLLFFLCAIACSQEALRTIDIWSGREQGLPFTAQSGWRVEAEHGRMLAKGQAKGPVKVTFPALVGKEMAFLLVDGQKVARLAIHPEKLLEGIAADCRQHRAEFECLGVKAMPAGEGGASCFFLSWNVLEPALGEPHSAAAKYVVFTEQRDFPLGIGDDWTEITVGLDRGNGTFSLVMDGRERSIDNSGGGVAWIAARRNKGEKILLLPPDFDLRDVNNILLIKREIEK